ncbi:MAG TPA: AMP-binding protein, partial [Planctomycetota bacterium]|nr:AMP-binding protein [Planctomycetota bacterium]
MNLNQQLARSVTAGAGRTAIVDGKLTVSYAELATLAIAAGRRIEALTTRPHVGVALPPSVSFAITYFGVTAAGRTVVPLNFLITGNELEHIVGDSGIDTVVTTAALAGGLRDKVAQVVLIEDEIRDLRSAAAALDPAGLTARTVPDDAPATLLYTSGTSARPKGVVLSHRNLVENCRSSIDALDLDAGHVLLAMLPFFHAFGLTTGLLLPLAFGGKTVMLARFNVPDLLSLVQTHRVSIILTIPSIWNAMLHSDVEHRADLSSLRICVSGGEPLPTQTYDRFLERMGFPLSEGYGLTETSPVVSIVPTGDRRRGSAGKPLPRVNVRILDNLGNDLALGTEGEICISGPSVMTGYHNLPDETARVMTPDGWFRTGDLG